MESTERFAWHRHERCGQLDLLRNQFPRFQREYEQFPTEPIGEPGRFHCNNDLFGGTDALVAYCMIRHFNHA